MNNQLITIIISIVASGIIAPFFRSFFDKIFATYEPDRKKIILVVRQIFLLSLKYGVPIASLIYLMLTSKQVDKIFVFGICGNLICISENFILDLLSRHLKMHRDAADTMLKLYDFTSILNERIEKISQELTALSVDSKNKKPEK